MIQRLLTIAFCILMLLPASHAQAEGPNDRAAELFQQGLEAFGEKDWQRAYALLSEAWALRKSYDIASNLGQAAYLIKKPVEAAERVSFALEHFPATGDPEQREQTAELMKLIRKEVAVLTFEVTPPDAEVFVDGASKGVASNLPHEVFVLPGPRDVKAALGDQSKAQLIDVQAAQEYSIQLEVSVSGASEEGALPGGASELVPASPPDSGTAPQSRSLMPIYIGAPLTGAALVTAIVFGAKSSSADNDATLYLARAQDEFGPNPCAAGTSSANCRRLGDALDDRETFGTTANVFFIASGVLAVGTTVAYLLWPTEPASTVALGLTPAASNNGGALLLRGTF
jgi:hypothetical protein